MARDFARRVLGSRASAPVSAFARSDFLSAGEIAELRRMLAEDDGDA
jgi:hypothetical protein